jgi:hypothetical protein
MQKNATTAPEDPQQQPRLPGGGKVGRKIKCWSKSDKVRVLRSIMLELVDGKVPHGCLTIIARNKNIVHAHVLRLWQNIRVDDANPADALSDVSLTLKRKAARLIFLFVVFFPQN